MALDETGNPIDSSADTVAGDSSSAITGGSAPLRASRPEALGERYETVSVLGRGGMGEVRLCRDRRIGRDVAIKSAHPELGHEAARRFEREALVQARLDHPSFVPVYDIVAGDGGIESFVMKRARGRTLRDVLTDLAEGRDVGLSRHRLLAAFVQLCLAVDYAHSRGVVHRDIKPENVMLGDFGEVLLLDWGIARLASEPETDAAVSPTANTASPAMTREGAILGTLGYMAPEQVRGEHGSLDARADVYSLGCLLFELATHERLHQGEQFALLIASTLGDPDARPSRRPRGEGAAPALDDICVKATRPLRDERYPSARALADAVESYLDRDRDDAARKARAEALGSSARAALSAAGDDLEARVRAGRQAAQALALDPASEIARSALLESLAEPPGAPAEVVAALESSRRDLLREMLREVALSTFVIKAVLSVLMVMVVAPFSPLLAWGAIAVGLASGAVLWGASRSPDPERLGTLGVALMCVENGLFTRWTSPYAVINMVALATALAFTMHASERVRNAWTVMCLAVVVLPALGEFSGVLAPTWIVGPQRAEFAPTMGPPIPTWVMLVHFLLVALTVRIGVDRSADKARKADAMARSKEWLLGRVLKAS